VAKQSTILIDHDRKMDMIRAELRAYITKMQKGDETLPFNVENKKRLMKTPFLAVYLRHIQLLFF
jgi:hypothetical protein